MPASSVIHAWTFAELLQPAGDYPAIQGKRQEVRAALADQEAAGWQRFPVPGVQASRDSSGNSQTVFSVQQPLWTGGRIRAGMDAAEARHGSALAEVERTREEVLLRLAQSFVEASRRQAQQDIALENLQQHERLRAMIERRIAQQVSPEVDLALADSRLSLARNELSLIQQGRQLALDRLRELSGQSVQAVEGEIQASAWLPATLPEALTQAEERAPGLRVLEYREVAAMADVRAERAQWWPLVALRLEQREGERTERRALIVLESQLGAGLSTLANAGAAQARRDAIAWERETVLRERQTQVTEAWRQMESAQQRLRNAEQNRRGSEEVFASYSRQYVIGQKSWLDVLNAVREATAAATSVEDARAELRLAQIRLGLLTGGIGSAFVQGMDQNVPAL